MNSQEYLNDMRAIQDNLYIFLENKDEIEQKFADLKDIFEDQKIQADKHKFKSLFHLLIKISNNHHRRLNFYDISKSNKRILLFLINENVITLNKNIIKMIIRDKYKDSNYPQYLSIEIEPFLNEKWFPKNYLYKEIKKELPELFDENRKIGENDNFICKLIQQDSVVDFIAYANKNSLSLNSTIPKSIYETHSFLIKKQINSDISLIEYAAFFGSIQIFRYLQMNGVELTPSLWIYAIHGKNAELIHFLEENNVKPEDGTYKECYKEAIKCHHNDIAMYIKDNLLQLKEEDLDDFFIQSLKYYNFAFIDISNINKDSFYDLCHYDYYLFVKNLIKERSITLRILSIIYSSKIQNQKF